MDPNHAIASAGVRLIGVGNRCRRDDGVGLFIAAHPALKRLPAVCLQREQTDAAGLLEALKAAEAAFLFDAVFTGNAPGTVYRFDAAAKRLPRGPFRLSTHGAGVVEAVELARVLGLLPEVLIVFGIEGKDFGFGAGLSPEVAAAALGVAQRVREEIRCLER